jgi:inner membrane protein
MTAANHVAGGAVFTALFASLIFGINVLASPWTIAAAIVSSLLPDIDHTRSTIGKAVYPIAKWINRKFGHRTLTHGFPFMASLIFIIGLAEKTFSGSLTITKVVSLGYFSHLLLDMFTLQGVPLLYPFNRAPFVMIGNPEMRIRTGDYRKETICFFIFIMAGLFMQPLFSKGFWTVWNQNLATMKHLHGEFVRSNDMLSVEYEIVEGLELKKGRGFCIESKSENEAWLLDSAGQWVLLKYPDCRHSLPTHTGRRFSLSSVTLISVSPDSLNRVLAGKIIQKIEVQANQQFQVTERNQFPKQTASFTADHLSQPPRPQLFGRNRTAPKRNPAHPRRRQYSPQRTAQPRSLHFQPKEPIRSHPRHHGAPAPA